MVGRTVLATASVRGRSRTAPAALVVGLWRDGDHSPTAGCDAGPNSVGCGICQGPLPEQGDLRFANGPCCPRRKGYGGTATTVRPRVVMCGAERCWRRHPSGAVARKGLPSVHGGTATTVLPGRSPPAPTRDGRVRWTCSEWAHPSSRSTTHLSCRSVGCGSDRWLHPSGAVQTVDSGWLSHG